jgi:hypothetical protein
MAATTWPVNMIRGGTCTRCPEGQGWSRVKFERAAHLHVVPELHVVEHRQALRQSDVRVRLVDRRSKAAGVVRPRVL